jgi:hypothetical protein
MIERQDGVAGYAIGGLSGGEEKGAWALLDIYIFSDHYNRYLLENVSFLPCIILCLPPCRKD